MNRKMLLFILLLQGCSLPNPFKSERQPRHSAEQEVISHDILEKQPKTGEVDPAK